MMKLGSLFVLSLIVFLLAGCKEQELFKGLDQVQANDVISLLQRNNIPATKLERAKEGFVIKVGPDDFSSAVALMTVYDRPLAPKIELAQMFPADSLISSPRAEKVRILSGIEQRLGQSIQFMSGVVAARVHVSYDLDGGEAGRKIAPSHVSALVMYERDFDSTPLINDVQRVLKNAFNDIDYSNVSVVLTPVSEFQYQGPILEQQRSNDVSFWFLASLLLLALVIGCSIAAAIYLIRKGKSE